MPGWPKRRRSSSARTRRQWNSTPACRHCAMNPCVPRNLLNKVLIMNAKLFTGMGLALALCACVTTPQPNAALESARAAVQAAEQDPNVSKYAALDLKAAQT